MNRFFLMVPRMAPRLKVLGLAAAAAVAAVSFVRASGDDAATPAAKLDYSGGITCYVRVADLERSMQWYQDVLGFEFLFKVDAIGWCELKSPVEHVTIGLLKIGKQEKTGASAAPERSPGEAPAAMRGGATVVFGVKDVDAARTTLEAAGVKFAGPTLVHEGYVRLAAFFDPDGNVYTLSQPLAPQEGPPH